MAASKKIEEISDKLFKYWFIDFNFPNSDKEPYQINGGEMKKTEYGFIPSGWEVATMGSVLTVSSEKVGTREGVPEYSTSNQGFSLVHRSLSSLTQNANKNKLIVKGDIIFGMDVKFSTLALWLTI